jgi:hypothetical protein
LDRNCSGCFGFGGSLGGDVSVYGIPVGFGAVHEPEVAGGWILLKIFGK